MPEVTIGMPVYNSERHIGEVLKCLLSQTYRNLRILIADNASTDSTAGICRDFAERDDRIAYVRHPQNLGATANYNYVACHAATTYFKWHSSNDLLSCNALESCVEILEARPEVALVFPSTRLFEVSVKESTRYDADPVADQDDPVERFLHIIDNMALNNMMNGVLRLDALRRTAMLREFYIADRGMMADLSLQGKLVKDEESIFFRRMDESSATQKKSAEEVLKHFDPKWTRPLPFTTWRTYRAYLIGLWSSGVGFNAALRGSMKVLGRAWWSRNHFLRDIGAYFIYAGHDLRQWILDKLK